jgi:FMN-dependent NADH-azoreductase
MLGMLKRIFSSGSKDEKVEKVLYITANPKSADQSFSLSVGKTFLDEYRQANPNDEIIELDLYKIDIPYIDTDVFNGWGKLQQGNAFEQLSEDEKDKVSRINTLTEQFISADKYVFVTPLWNFGFPPRVKAYIDTICIAGKTFKYTETGPVGLLTDKKAVHIQARGGVYSEGPAKDMEFGDKYIQSILSFLGVPSIESIIVEGMAQMPNEAENIKAKAMERAKEVAKQFADKGVTV